MSIVRREDPSNVVHVDFEKSRAGAAGRRLRRATREMAEELRKQKREVLVFRAEMRRLDTEMKNLVRSLETYRNCLTRIDTAPLRRKARRLARIMESIEASPSRTPSN